MSVPLSVGNSHIGPFGINVDIKTFRALHGLRKYSLRLLDKTIVALGLQMWFLRKFK